MRQDVFMIRVSRCVDENAPEKLRTFKMAKKTKRRTSPGRKWLTDHFAVMLYSIANAGIPNVVVKAIISNYQ